MPYHVLSYHLLQYHDVLYHRNGKQGVEHTICTQNLSIPESVVSPGIALAMSAMAFPSSCILPVLANEIAVLALVIIIPRRTNPKRKIGCIMIPISTGQMD